MYVHQLKQLVWTVVPRFELETTTLDMEVTIPQTQQMALAVTRVAVEDMLSCSVDQSHTSSGLELSCVVSYFKASASESLTATLTVQVLN